MADHTTKQIETLGRRGAGARPSQAMFAALLGAVLADAWLASTPLPLGGPNVWFAALLLLLTAHHVVTRMLATGIGWRSLAYDYRAVLVACLPAALLLAWAGIVFARSGGFDVVQLGRMAFGIGVLCATAVCVDSVGRAKAMLLAVLLSAVASALFGFGTLFVGEPFLGAWERLATIDDDAWEMVLLGRMAGLTSHSSTLALQLVVALAVVPAVLVWRSAAMGVTRSLGLAAALALAATLILAALLNGHRATTIGATAGCVAIAAFGWRVLRGTERLRLLWMLPMLGVWAGVVAQLAPTVFCADAAEQRLRLERAGDIGPLYKDRLRFRERPPGDDSAPHVLGHRFENLGIRQQVLEVRPLYAAGQGEASAFVLNPTWRYAEVSWYEPADAAGVSAYEFRRRPVAKEDGWTTWQRFVPAMSSRGQLFFDPVVDYGSAASPQTASDLGDDPRFRAVRHVLAGLHPKHKYLLQLEMQRAEHRTMFPLMVRASALGEAPLLWFVKSHSPAPQGHRVRARLPTGDEWTPWQPLARAADIDDRPAGAHSVDGLRTTLKVGDLRRAPRAETQATHTPFDYLCHYVRGERFGFFGASSASRLRQAVDALHHLAANMLGAGTHFPERSAPRRSTAENQRLDLVVDTAPHNQVLHVAVLFGLPGLALLGVFYAVVCWAAVRTVRLASSTPSPDCHFLAAAVVGAVVAYTTVSLSMPIGPFTFGWGHFYLLGLLFAVLRLVDAHSGADPQ